MAINTTLKKRAAGGLHTTTATEINNLDFPAFERNDKAFSTFCATYALKGQVLHRTDLADTPVKYWAERREPPVRHLPTIDAVHWFLEQIGGRL